MDFLERSYRCNLKKYNVSYTRQWLAYLYSFQAHPKFKSWLCINTCKLIKFRKGEQKKKYVVKKYLHLIRYRIHMHISMKLQKCNLGRKTLSNTSHPSNPNAIASSVKRSAYISAESFEESKVSRTSVPPPSRMNVPSTYRFDTTFNLYILKNHSF